MSVVRKALGVVREFGPGGAFLYLANRSLQKLGGAIHLYYFVAQPVPEAPLLPPSRGRSIAVRVVEPDDPILLILPLNRAVIGYRSAQGAICLGAFIGDKIIGCIWLCLGPYLEDEVRFRFDPGNPVRSAWDFDVYLLPDYRGGLGFRRLWDEANHFLRERGIFWSMSRISSLNNRSRAAHARLGAQRIATALFLRLGEVQLSLSSRRPFAYFSVGPERVPNFSLRPGVKRSD